MKPALPAESTVSAKWIADSPLLRKAHLKETSSWDQKKKTKREKREQQAGPLENRWPEVKAPKAKVGDEERLNNRWEASSTMSYLLAGPS